MLRIASALVALALAAPAPSLAAPGRGEPAGSASFAQSQPAPPLVIHESDARPPLETLAIDAAYGGVAGALVGTGVALVEQGHFWRDLTVGAGAGIIVGAVVGGVQAYSSARSLRVATDGLGSPQRDPPLSSVHTVLAYHGTLP